MIAALVALALIRFGSSFLRRWAGGRLSLDVQHDMRQDVFGSLQRLDGAGQDRLRTGQVVSRASTDLQMVQGCLAMVPLSAGQVVLFVVSLVIMLTLSPLLTAMSLLVVPGVVLLTRATRTVLFPATWAAQQSAAEVAEIVEEDVTGVRVVKGFGQEDREIGRLRDGARGLYANRMRAVRMTAQTHPGTAGADRARPGRGARARRLPGPERDDHASAPSWPSRCTWRQLVAPTRTLSLLLVLGQQARASVERVLEIIDSRPEIVDPADPTPAPGRPAGRRLHAACGSATSPRNRCSTGSTCTCRPARRSRWSARPGRASRPCRCCSPGSTTRRPGRCASAESTSATCALADLRRAVGVVFEEAFLFSDTIAANIGYGRPDATDAEIRAAATGRRGRRLHRGAAATATTPSSASAG